MKNSVLKHGRGKASAERSPKRTKSPRSRKKVDEMTATEETQEIVDSGLPQLPTAKNERDSY